MKAVGALGIVLVLSMGCSFDDAGSAGTVSISRADTLLDERAEELGGISDMALDEGGDLYIADPVNSQIVVLREQARPAILGRRGGGPGEFANPVALAVEGDSIRVVDAGNGAVQIWTKRGEFARSFPLPIQANAGPVSIAGDGRLAAATLGITDEGLAVLLDPHGRPQGTFGRAAAGAGSAWDVGAIKAEIARGDVPGVFRNIARPIVAEEGGLWLVHDASGIVERYDPRARVLWSFELTGPEVSRIKQDFFDRNRRERRPMAFFPLSYVADAVSRERELWILLNVPEEDPSVVIVLSREGALRRRLVFESVRGARQLAVGRERIYLAVPSTLAVVGAELTGADSRSS